MAWTTTKVVDYGIGNVRVQHWDLTGDSATIELSTGLSNVLSVTKCIKSMNSANHHIYVNKNSTAVDSAGLVSVTGCTSGDTFFLQIVGT